MNRKIFTFADVLLGAFIGFTIGLSVFCSIYIYHKAKKAPTSLKINDTQYLEALNLDNYQATLKNDVIYESADKIESVYESGNIDKFSIQK
jgi:hypothetical protein